MSDKGVFHGFADIGILNEGKIQAIVNNSKLLIDSELAAQFLAFLISKNISDEEF